MKKFILSSLFVSLFFSFSGQAQVSVAGHFTFLHFMGGTGVNMPGLGLNLQYARDNGRSNHLFIYEGGFNYHFGGKEEYTDYATAFSSSTTPSQVEVPVTEKFKFIMLYLGTRRYFVGELDEDESVGIYGMFHVSYVLGKSTITEGAYDKSLYYTVGTEGDVIGTVTANLGLGVDKSIGPVYLFGEILGNIPTGSTSEGFDLPFSVSMNVGARLLFGK